MTDPFDEMWMPFGSWHEPPDSVPLHILGLDVRPDSQDEVRSAFRARIKAAHPDVAPTMDDDGVPGLVWARDVLLRKIPAPVTADGLTTGSGISRNTSDGVRRVGSNGYPLCKGCGEEYRASYCNGESRWRGYCLVCADDAEKVRLQELRRQARADRTCENANCAATFAPGRADGRFCSNTCRQAAYRTRTRSPTIAVLSDAATLHALGEADAEPVEKEVRGHPRAPKGVVRN
jgi:hypothetical protein